MAYVVEKRPQADYTKTMHDSNFTARERVAHKLTGAAYQMTFVEEYDLAMQAAARAVEFWEATRDEPLSDDEAAHLYGHADLLDSLPKAVTDGMNDEQVVSDPVENGHSTDDQQTADASSGDEVELPGRGTQAREAIDALLRANDDGADWVRTSELKEYCATENAPYQIATLAKQNPHINWKKQTGKNHGHLYRIAPDDRDALRTALRRNGSSLAEAEA